MKPKFPPARHVVIHVGDDHWWLAAVVMLYAGCAASLLGLLSSLGWIGSVPDLPAVVATALVGICVGAWVLYRRLGIVIDSSESTITLRGPFSERHLLLSDLSHIEIQPSQLPLTFELWAPFSEERYDVVLCAENSELALYHGLDLSTAHTKADVIADATGYCVLRG